MTWDYVNAGARIDGRDPVDRDELLAVLAEQPDRVRIYSTSPFGPHAGRVFDAADVPEGVNLTVCGPNPVHPRDWFVNVVRGDDGRPRERGDDEPGPDEKPNPITDAYLD